MNKIDKIWAEEIKDSRGNPTLKVTVFSGDNSASFSVPSGASTGIHEANVIDNNKAIQNVNEIIAPQLAITTLISLKPICREKIMSYKLFLCRR